MKKTFWGGIIYFFVMAILSFIMLCGCATKKHIEYRDSIVTQYITKVEKDTLIQHVHDSVYVQVTQRGDTIFVEKYKERVAYKDRVVIKTDTCYRDKVINNTQYDVKEVKYIPSIYKYALGLCILLIIIIIYKIIKWILKVKD